MDGKRCGARVCGAAGRLGRVHDRRLYGGATAMCRRAVISTLLSIHHWLGYPQRHRSVSSVVERFTAEVAVVGGGPAGLVSALALAAAGVDTLLIAPPAAADHRTTALLAGSVTALETLGVWEACRPQAAPLRKIRIIDDTQRLIRAPETVFDAAEIDLEAFGYNIENRYLLAALDAHAAALKLPRISAEALAVKVDDAGATIVHAGGDVRVRL